MRTFPRRTLLIALIPASIIVALTPWLDPILEPSIPVLDAAVRLKAIVPLYVACLLASLASSKSGRTWLAGCIPSYSPRVTGLFRVAFSAGLIVAVRAMTPAGAERTICLTCLVLFGLGLATRIAFLGFVCAFTWMHFPQAGEHDLALPIKTYWLMTLVPWGDGLSLDEWIRGRFGFRTHNDRSQAYGLAVWIPITMLGVAYAGASYAKLDQTGLGWITHGSVKYIFLADGHNAPVHWGKYIVRSDLLSVLLSAGAVLAEFSVILAAMWPSTALITIAGLVALGLHLGFWLFQGIWWDYWWTLLPAFLPWPWLESALERGRQVGGATAARISWTTATILFIAVLQQPVASMLRYTYSFLLSDFPMYANVYPASRAEVAATQEKAFQPLPRVRLVVSGTPGGDADEARLHAIDPEGRLAAAARKLEQREPLTDTDVEQVRAVAAAYLGPRGAVPARADLVADTWRFDWSIADFVPRNQWSRVATIDLGDGAITPLAN